MPAHRFSPALLLPGLLVAATGVGAGDLATAGFAGSAFGLTLLWAVALGAGLKFVLNEGVARYQLATGRTVLEGATGTLGPAFTAAFVIYLLPWSYFTGAALISACGVTAHAIVPGMDDPATARLVWGAVHSAAGVAVAWFGGFRLFERVMTACIAVMFVTVIVTGFAVGPDWAAAARGLLVPSIPPPHGDEHGLTWAIALTGGVGGTLTVLCYGYWMREAGRTSIESLTVCRIDLVVAYGATGLFGMAMLVIASGTTISGRGADLIVSLATQLESGLGTWARWVFLIGAWAAVFSSLLGVWQAVPFIFADLWRRGGPVSTRGLPYRIYLIALATVPMLQVTVPLRQVQKAYAVLGAAFIPMLALLLLVLNGRRAGEHRNRVITVVVLTATLAFFLVAGFLGVRSTWSR